MTQEVLEESTNVEELSELDRLIMDTARTKNISLKEARAQLAAELDEADADDDEDEEEQNSTFGKVFKYLGIGLAIGAGFFGVAKGLPYFLDLTLEVSRNTVEKAVKREVRERVEQVSSVIREIQDAGNQLIMSLMDFIMAIQDLVNMNNVKELAIAFGKGVWEDGAELAKTGDRSPDKLLDRIHGFVNKNPDLLHKWNEVSSAHKNLISKKEVLAKTVEEVTSFSQEDEDELIKDVKAEVSKAIEKEKTRLKETMQQNFTQILQLQSND